MLRSFRSFVIAAILVVGLGAALARAACPQVIWVNPVTGQICHFQGAPGGVCKVVCTP